MRCSSSHRHEVCYRERRGGGGGAPSARRAKPSTHLCKDDAAVGVVLFRCSTISEAVPQAPRLDPLPHEQGAARVLLVRKRVVYLRGEWKVNWAEGMLVLLLMLLLLLLLINNNDDDDDDDDNDDDNDDDDDEEEDEEEDDDDDDDDDDDPKMGVRPWPLVPVHHVAEDHAMWTMWMPCG